MKKSAVYAAIVLILVLLPLSAVYGQNTDFVPGSHLWQEGSYLMGIPQNTSCGEAAANFVSGAVIRDTKGRILSGSAAIGTGMTLQATETLTVLLSGDVNGDGRLSSADYVQIKRAFSGERQLQAVYFKAADINKDGRISSADYVAVKRELAGTSTLYKGMSAEPYVSEREYREYDLSGYRMDRSKLTIGSYYMTKDILSEQFIKDYKNDFHGDYIACGITGTGTNAKNFFKWCDKYGVGVIARNNGITKYTFSSAASSGLDLTSWTNFENQLAAYPFNNSCIWGDEIFDEPFPEHLPWIAGTKPRYDARFPDRLAYYNLNPMAIWGDKFEQDGDLTYVEYVDAYTNAVDTDYISFDIYPFDNYQVRMHGYYLDNLDAVSTICRETGKDFWIIMQNGAKGEATRIKKEQISWQMYASLAYGAKSIMHACLSSADGWWAEGESLVDQDGTYNQNWYDTAALNAEIKAFGDVYMQYDNLGVFGAGKTANCFVFNQIRRQNDRNALRAINGARGFSDVSATRGLLVGSFERSDKEGYAMMLVDTSDPFKGENGSGTVSFRSALEGDCTVKAYLEGTETELQPVNGVYTISLTNGQGCFVTIERKGA